MQPVETMEAIVHDSYCAQIAGTGILSVTKPLKTKLVKTGLEVVMLIQSFAPQDVYPPGSAMAVVMQHARMQPVKTMEVTVSAPQDV